MHVGRKLVLLQNLKVAWVIFLLGGLLGVRSKNCSTHHYEHLGQNFCPKIKKQKKNISDDSLNVKIFRIWHLVALFWGEGARNFTHREPLVEKIRGGQGRPWGGMQHSPCICLTNKYHIKYLHKTKLNPKTKKKKNTFIKSLKIKSGLAGLGRTGPTSRFQTIGCCYKK